MGYIKVQSIQSHLVDKLRNTVFFISDNFINIRNFQWSVLNVTISSKH